MKLILKYKDWFYFANLASALQDCRSVLDLGCGPESPLSKIPNIYYSVGMDIFKPSIEISRKKKIHDEYVVADIRSVNKYFKSQSFDAVIALDVIEHFSKKEAMKIISDMEKIARKRVIIFTPNGFYDQDPYHGNPYQRHKSGWTVEEFKKLGYKIKGLRGVMFIRGEFATIKYKPWFLWAMISFLSEPIFNFFPSFSYQLFAYKKL